MKSRIVSGALALGIIAVGAPAAVAAPAEEQVSLVVGVRDGNVSTLDASIIRTVRVSASRKAQVVAELRRDPNVAYVEVDQVAHTADVQPNDTHYVNGSQQPEVDRVRLPAAWGRTTGSAGVTIAVLDTGVSAVGDLRGAVLNGYNYVGGNSDVFDDNGHGTAVSSLVAGRGNDGYGIAGGCWQCRILPVKVMNAAGEGLHSNIAKGIRYATDRGAAVINMSLGGTTGSQVLSDAVAYANAKGVLVVAAAGNSNSTTKFYPAAYPDVLGVGATARGSDARASFSNYNAKGATWVDLAAPGEVFVMTPDGDDELGGGYGYATGTSFASPMVAGAAGLVKSAHPGWTGWSVGQALLTSGRSITTTGWTAKGALDAAKAIDMTTDTTAPKVTGFSPGQNANVRGKATVTIAASDNWSGVRSVALYVDGVYKAQDTAAPYQLVVDTKGANRTAKISVRLYDKAGNTTVVAKTYVFDNAAPTVSIASGPKNKAKVKGTVKFTVKAADRNGVSKVQMLVNGKVKATDSKAPHTFSLKASSYGKTIKVQFRAYDKAGNVRYTPVRTYTR